MEIMVTADTLWNRWTPFGDEYKEYDKKMRTMETATKAWLACIEVVRNVLFVVDKTK